MGRSVSALGYVWNAAGPGRPTGEGNALRRRIVQVARAKRFELLKVIDHLPIPEDLHGGSTRNQEAALLDLLERARRGEFDVLIVATTTRLPNESATRAFLELRLRHHGAELEWFPAEKPGSRPST